MLRNHGVVPPGNRFTLYYDQSADPGGYAEHKAWGEALLLPLCRMKRFFDKENDLAGSSWPPSDNDCARKGTSQPYETPPDREPQTPPKGISTGPVTAQQQRLDNLIFEIPKTVAGAAHRPYGGKQPRSKRGVAAMNQWAMMHECAAEEAGAKGAACGAFISGLKGARW
jgi:hypothetical protein